MFFTVPFTQSLTLREVAGPNHRHSDPDPTVDWLSGEWKMMIGCCLSWRCATRGNCTVTTEK